GEEVVVEPVHGAGLFDPRPDFARQQAQFAELGPSGLVEVFGDDGCPRNRGTTFLHHHRSRASGIEDEKFLAAFPHTLLDRARGDAVFAERQAYETRVRAERVVEQCQHAALRIAALLGRRRGGVTLGWSRPYGWGRSGATCAMFAPPRCSEVNDAGKPRLPDFPAPCCAAPFPLMPAEPAMSFELFKAFVLGV